MKTLILLLALCSALSVLADLKTSFPKGQGAQYKLFTQGGAEADVSVSIAQVSDNEIETEIFMQNTASQNLKLWQYFTLKKNGATFDLTKGLILTPEMNGIPEIMTSEMLKGQDKGVAMTDFLFTDEKELKPFDKGMETLDVPAGKSKARHYQKNSGGQTVDFWIAENARPIGLLKLVSQSKDQKDQNYTLMLTGLIRNVSPTIQPARAIPLTEKGKSILETKKDK